MSSPFEKLKIKKEDDRRYKLNEAERAEIVALYKAGELSQRQLAVKFGVSRRLIQFCLDPEKLARHKQMARLRSRFGYYYDKDKQREYMRSHRKHKRALFLEGKLVK